MEKEFLKPENQDAKLNFEKYRKKLFANNMKDYKESFNLTQNYINDERLTDHVKKNPDIRIFIKGPCIALGCYSSQKLTIESILQKLINKESERFEVVNEGRIYVSKEQDNYNVAETDIIIFLGKSSNFMRRIIKKYNIKTFNLSCAFNRPHNHGYCLLDNGGLHMNSNGNKVVANFIFEKILEEIRKRSKLKFVNKDFIKFEKIDKTLKKCEEFKDKNKEFVEFLNTLNRDKNKLFKKIGCVVVNCNPFTLGHKYLIEESYNNVDFLYIFVVEEDKSIFPFEERIELVKKNTTNLSNIEIIRSSNGIISNETFPYYFKKDYVEILTPPCLDIEIFCSIIAPILNIKQRFVGEEPLDKVTRKYNKLMQLYLPKYGIDFTEIKRKRVNEKLISASTVRKLIEKNNFEEIKKYVPEPTYEYLKSKFLKK